jgi:hypothetical protein
VAVNPGTVTVAYKVDQANRLGFYHQPTVKTTAIGGAVVVRVFWESQLIEYTSEQERLEFTN